VRGSLWVQHDWEGQGRRGKGIEWLDEGLAGELDRMNEASDVVAFVKGVLEFVDGGYLDVI
jgi:hypothetical protein